MKTIQYRNAAGDLVPELPKSALIGGKLVTGPLASAGWTLVEITESKVIKQVPRQVAVLEQQLRALAAKYVPVEELDKDPAKVIAAIEVSANLGTTQEQVNTLKDAIKLQQLYLAVKELGGGPESSEYLQESTSVTEIKQTITPK
jgi:hypothetical protein